MTTSFSQLVDKIVTSSMLMARRLDAPDALNATLQDLYVHPKDNKPLRFDKDMIEDELTADATPFVWPLPSSRAYIQFIRYPQFSDSYNPEGVEPKFIRPSPGLSRERWAWYRTGNNLIFKGVFKDQLVHIAYFMRPRQFRYYEVGSRPAYWDEDSESWVYHPDYDTDDAKRKEALDRVSHWLMDDWMEVLREGSMAKLFKLAGEQVRGPTHYSDFQRRRISVLSFESWQYMQSITR